MEVEKVSIKKKETIKKYLPIGKERRVTMEWQMEGVVNSGSH
jgi:hypothetical protein